MEIRRRRAIIAYPGDLDFFDEQRALGEKQRQAQYDRQQAMLSKELKFIERFKARASHAAQVQSRVKKLDKIEKVEPPRRRQSVRFEFRSPPRSGDDVVSFRNVHKGYGTQPIYAGLDLRMRRQERWCVLGANGAGKSTLLKLVAGAADPAQGIGPDKGSVTLGASVKMGYFLAQHSMDLLDGEDTVFESLDASFPQAGTGALKSLAGCFGFSGDDVEKPCRVLSGGEKARLVMAKMLFDPPNFLVLDEPTNHLDMATKEMLVAALADFEGTMLFVSHDRHFLAALSNRVLELTPEGVHQYGGGYTEYVARTGQEAPGLHPGAWRGSIGLRRRPVKRASSTIKEEGTSMTQVPQKPLVPGNSLITATPEEGRALAIMLARNSIHAMQGELETLKAGRAEYAKESAGLIAASHVIAVEFATVAAANNYWR